MKKDVFLSYASRDSKQIEAIVHALEASGISVWWDREIPPGKTWDAVLGKALQEARCVIVFWTGHSVHSDWVKDEAARGKQRKILVPALLEDVDIPLGFGRIEAADLRHWDGDTSHPEFVNFLNAIRSTIGQEVETGQTSPALVTTTEGHRFKLWQLILPLLLVLIPFLAYQLFYSVSTQLVTELWNVEGDRKSALLATNTFSKDAGMDKVDSWLVQELKKAAPTGKSPIKINLHVPADLKSETVMVSTEPPVELKTFIYVVSGSTKARVRSPLTQKRLALMEEDFFIEFGRTGFLSETIKIKLGEVKTKTFTLRPKKIAVAVEHFDNDHKNLATRLSRQLASHQQLKVTTPDALDNLRQELIRANEAVGINRAVQNAIRDSLGVDFIISGALEKE